MTKQINETFNYDYSDKQSMEDKQNRSLFLFDDIEDAIASDIIYQVIEWNREDKYIPAEERKPIYFYIFSYGGDVPAGLSIIDIVQTSITPIYTINLGACYSMAFYIFLSGKVRYSLPNASFLLHEGNSMSFGSTHKAIDRMKFEELQTEKRIKDYVLSRTSISEKLYDENLRKEWYFYPEEAKSYNIVDYIIGGADSTLDDIISDYYRKTE